MEDDGVWIRWCTSCETMSAMEVHPGRYACVSCRETGTVGEPPIPDSEPDEALRRALRALPERITAEFTALAKMRLKLGKTPLRRVK